MKLTRTVVGMGASCYEPAPDDAEQQMLKLLQDSGLPSLQSKAKALATLVKISDDAAMSR